MSGWPWAAKAELAHGSLLTQTERCALAYARHSRLQGINAEEIAALPNRSPDQQARFEEAFASLQRFGLVDAAYDRDYRPRMRGRGWLYRINAAGEAIFPHAHTYRCCDDCVVLNCVCAESTFCPEHGGGCHGTHD